MTEQITVEQAERRIEEIARSILSFAHQIADKLSEEQQSEIESLLQRARREEPLAVIPDLRSKLAEFRKWPQSGEALFKELVELVTLLAAEEEEVEGEASQPDLPQGPHRRQPRRESSQQQQSDQQQGDQQSRRQSSRGEGIRTWFAGFNDDIQDFPGKWFGFVGAIVVLALVLGGGGYLVYDNFISNDEPAPVTTTITQPQPATQVNPLTGQPVQVIPTETGATTTESVTTVTDPFASQDQPVTPVQSPNLLVQTRDAVSGTLRTLQVVMILVLVILFLEVRSRKEKLDFLAVLFFFAILAIREKIGSELWWAYLMGVASSALAAAVYYNYRTYDEDEDESIMDRLDFSSIVALSGLLLLLNRADWVLFPYPSYIPIQVVWGVFILSAGFELFAKTPIGAIAAVVGGLLAGYAFHPMVILIIWMGMFVLVGIVANEKGKHRRTLRRLPVMGSFTLAYDVYLLMMIVFGLGVNYFYGNPALSQLGQMVIQ